MRSNTQAPTVARRLLPLAAGAAVVLVAISAASQRSQRHRRQVRYQVPAPTAQPVALEAPAAHVAPLAHVAPEAPAATRDEPRKVRGRLGPVLVAIAVVLSGLGIGLVGVAVASQRRVPAPPSTAPATSPAPDLQAVRDTWGWEASARTDVVAAPPTEQPSPAPSPVATELVLPKSRPVSLSIPAIGVRSVVNDVGQADDGSLETPKPGPDYNEAAWYRHSPTPGSLGPSILLGHVDSAAEGPSVFFRLGELKAGDRVAVTRADTSVAVFRVDLVQRYAKNDFPTDTVYGNIDHAGLRIVTCGGAFDSSAGHYLDNVVVFASLIDSPAR